MSPDHLWRGKLFGNIQLPHHDAGFQFQTTEMAKRTECVNELTINQRCRARRVSVIKIAERRIRMLPDDRAIFTVEALKNVVPIQCIATTDNHKTIGDCDSPEAISG